MNRKKICVITGTRSEYGILRLILQKIIKSAKLDLQLLVTGMHLLEKYGKTIDLIKEDNIPIAKTIPMYKENSIDQEDLGNAVGKAIINFSEALVELKPDILLVLGDRYEPLAAVIAASTQSLPIAHIHGGDKVINGQVDEQIRHAITKFAHIHFPATPKSAKRIHMMGEENWRINMVGSPSIDMIYKEKLLDKKEVFTNLGLNQEEKTVLCLQHPYLIEPEKAGKQMRLTFKVLKEFQLQTVIIYPNNDPGNELIIEEIEKNRKIPYFRIFKNLSRRFYLSLLKYAVLLIGNSSSGLIESAVFNIPVVNIGNRNKGRESGENVINVSHNYKEIKQAIDKALSEDFIEFCKNVTNPYGDGNASEKIVKILSNLKINKKLLVKKLDYEI